MIVAFYYDKSIGASVARDIRVPLEEFDLKIPHGNIGGPPYFFGEFANGGLEWLVKQALELENPVFDNCEFFANAKAWSNGNVSAQYFVRCKSLEDMMVVKILGLENGSHLR